MPKISATNSKGLFIGYFLRVLLSTIISIVLFSLISSLILLKLDLDLSVCKYLSVVIVLISSVIIAIVCTIGFKNNFLLLSVISEIPFALFILINMLVNSTNSIFCIIKLAVIFASALIISLIRSAKKR